MNAIQLKLNDAKKGAFVIDELGETVAEMEIGISGSDMTVYHTRVADKLKGQGVAAQLFNEMLSYARSNNLKVVPHCTYVLAQFKRHPERYEDVWNKDFNH